MKRLAADEDVYEFGGCFVNARVKDAHRLERDYVHRGHRPRAEIERRRGHVVEPVAVAHRLQVAVEAADEGRRIEHPSGELLDERTALEETPISAWWSADISLTSTAIGTQTAHDKPKASKRYSRSGRTTANLPALRACRREYSGAMGHSTALVRPRRRVIAGVCAGLARRFDVSPTLVRVLFVVSCLLPGPQVLLYVALWIITPSE